MTPEEEKFITEEAKRRAIDSIDVPDLSQSNGWRDVILHPMTIFAGIATVTTLAAPWVSESMGAYMGNALKFGISTYPAYLTAALPIKAVGTYLGRDWFDKSRYSIARGARDFLGSIGLAGSALGASEIIATNTSYVDKIVNTAGMNPATASTLIEMTDPTLIINTIDAPTAAIHSTLTSVNGPIGTYTFQAATYLDAAKERFLDFYGSFSSAATASSTFMGAAYVAAAGLTVAGVYYANKIVGNPIGRSFTYVKDYFFRKDPSRTPERSSERDPGAPGRFAFVSKLLSKIRAPFNRYKDIDIDLDAPLPPPGPAPSPGPEPSDPADDIDFMPLEDLDFPDPADPKGKGPSGPTPSPSPTPRPRPSGGHGSN